MQSYLQNYWENFGVSAEEGSAILHKPESKHELVHYIQSSNSGPKKGFVVKLDMSKAYDRVE